MLAGTLDYMSPEQTHGERADAASDIFSLGTLLYELVCGRHPFQAASPIDTAYAIAHNTPQSPAEVRPQVPAGLSTLLLDMLAKTPAARPTAREVAGRLASIDSSAARARFPLARVLQSAMILAALVAVAWIGHWYSRTRSTGVSHGQVI